MDNDFKFVIATEAGDMTWDVDTEALMTWIQEVLCKGKLRLVDVRRKDEAENHS